ncbi:hypothetical protein ES708_23384 [subsurface metagenome]
MNRLERVDHCLSGKPFLEVCKAMRSCDVSESMLARLQQLFSHVFYLAFPVDAGGWDVESQKSLPSQFGIVHGRHRSVGYLAASPEENRH